MTDTDHRCRRGAACADREKITERPAACESCSCHSGFEQPCDIPGGCGHLHEETTTWRGAQIAAADGLCRLCRGRVAQAIAHLPLDVAELTVLMASGSGGEQGAKVRGTPTPPIPIRVGIEALRADIDHELQCWAEPVAEALGAAWDTDAAHHSRIGHRVQRAAKLLDGAVDTLLALPAMEHMAWADGLPVLDAAGERDTVWRDGIDGAIALTELHRRAFVVAGRTRLVHRLGSPCPWCGRRTLTRENGASEVLCESDYCRGRIVPESAYDWLAAVCAAENKRQKAAA